MKFLVGFQQPGRDDTWFWHLGYVCKEVLLIPHFRHVWHLILIWWKTPGWSLFNPASFTILGNNNASGSQIDDKSGQWFGASVHSSGQDGIIVVIILIWLFKHALKKIINSFKPSSYFEMSVNWTYRRREISIAESSNAPDKEPRLRVAGRDGPWPDPSKFLTRCKFCFFRENFPNPSQRWLTRPDPSNKKLIRPNPG